jgi:hypothetical protein
MIMSKKKLVPLLVEQGFITSEKNVSYEAFGRKVLAFVHTADVETRMRLESFLQSKGLNFDRRYWPGSSVACVQVTYFKAWHWDE